MQLLKKAMKHPEVYPLVGIIGFAAMMGSAALVRSALVYPDIVWNHKDNPNPWLTIKQDEQKKLWASHDYKDRQGQEPPKF